MKKSKVLTKMLAITLAFALVLTSAFSATSFVSAATKAKKVTINKKSVALSVGEQFQLSVKSVTPKKAKKAVSYKSNKKKIAAVSNKGLITAKKKGKATITVTSKSNKKAKATCKVTVKAGTKNKSIKLSKQTLALVKGQTEKLTVTWNPAKTSVKKLTWSSSNKSVATIAGGTVKAISKGSATITAVNTYGKSAKCTVTVTEQGTSTTPTPTPIVTPAPTTDTITKITGVTLSGTDLTEKVLSVPYGTTEADVLAKLAALSINGTVAEGKTAPTFAKPTWTITDYVVNKAGDYVASATLTAPVDYEFTDVAIANLSVTVKVEDGIEITATTLSGTDFTGNVLEVPYGTKQADVITKLAALTVAGTVADGKTAPTFTNPTWTVADYVATAGNYTATATLIAPIGYKFAEGIGGLSVTVKVTEGIEITGATLSETILEIENGTDEDTVRVQLADLEVTATVATGTAPAVAKASSASWSFEPEYAATRAGSYEATATLVAPVGYKFATDVGDVSVTVKVGEAGLPDLFDLNAVTALYMETAPTIDGEELPSENWKGIKTPFIPENIAWQTGYQEGDSDTAGTFKVGWNADALYIIAQITDADLDDTSANAHEQDSIEIFLDELGCGGQEDGKYNDDDGQYRINYKGVVTGSADATSRVTTSTKTTDDGYTIEAKIAFKDDYKDTITAGCTMGLDLQINDAKGGKRVKTMNISENATGNSWQNVQEFGSVILVGGVAKATFGTPDMSEGVDLGASQAWDNARAFVLPVNGEGYGIDDKATGTRATCKMLWDEDALYVLAIVTDNTPDISAPEEYWQDSVELFLDQDPTTHNYQSGKVAQVRMNYENLQTIGNADNTPESALDRLTSRTKPILNENEEQIGYVVEMKFAFLPETTIDNTTVMGIDFLVNACESAKRTATLSMFDSTGEGWNNASLFGKLVFLPEPTA